MRKTTNNKKELTSRIEQLINNGVKKTEGIKVLVREFGISESTAKEEWIRAKENDVTLQEKAVRNALMNGTIGDNKSLLLPSDLKIEEIKGTYKGINFLKNSTGLQVGEEHFKDVEELKKYVKIEHEKFQKELNDFNSKVKSIKELFDIKI